MSNVHHVLLSNYTNTHTHTELERREQSHPFLLKKGIVSSLVFYPLRPMRSFHYYSTPSDFFCLCQYIQHIHCVPASTSRPIDVTSPVNQTKKNKKKQKKGRKNKTLYPCKDYGISYIEFSHFLSFSFLDWPIARTLFLFAIIKYRYIVTQPSNIRLLYYAICRVYKRFL